VFTPAFTFVAAAEAARLLGATPVFLDVDEGSFLLDADLLDKAARKVAREGKLRPKAVIPADIFGALPDYGAISEVAARHGLFVLEDAAQGFGARRFGRRAGCFGHAAATSFFPSKPLGCYGDGGAVFTDDGALADALRSIRSHGRGGDKYDNVRVGLNARLDTLQAAVVLVKLGIFDEELSLRSLVTARYLEALEGAVTPPKQVEWFPTEGILPGFPRLVPQSVLGLRMLRRGYMAQYGYGRAFVVEEASEAAAEELMAKLKERFQPSGTVALGAGGFTATDRYLKNVCLFRVGNKVAGLTGLAEGADAAKLAAPLAGRIK
jgi:hypothetical protein